MSMVPLSVTSAVLPFNFLIYFIRKVCQNKLLDYAKGGTKGVDLTHMIGQKKEWKEADNIDGGEVTTWDYKGKGGILTFDGEHLNRRGVALLLDVVLAQFRKMRGFWTEPITITEMARAGKEEPAM